MTSAYAETILQDIRYAARILRRDLGFATFTILIIALGIAASATVFSVVNSILLRPLPFKDPASLVWITNKVDTDDNMSGRTVQVVPAVAFRDRNHSLSGVAAFFAFYSPGDIRLVGNGEPERLTGVPVSENFFPLLGVQPLLGRQFTNAECQWNGPKVTILSYAFWQRRFAGDPSIVGKPLRLDDELVTVVGVMPASFDFGAVFAPGTQVDVFAPFPLSKETDRWGNTLSLVGRIKPGVPLSRAQAEADILSTQITSENPQRNPLNAQIAMLSDQVSGKNRPALIVLACAVGVVMLIVCANLSGLMLARTAARQKEMAIRSALGAARQRLVRQLLTESLILTSCGALLGILLAFAATRGIAHLTAFKLPLLSSVQIDLPVLAITVLIAMVTGIVLGLAPAWSLSGLALNASLVQRGAGAREHSWLRGSLVVAEMAFACVLLVGAGLLVRSLIKVLDVQLGFRPQSAATIRLDPSSQYDTNAKKIAWLDDILQRVRSLNGTEAAGMTDALPLGKNRTWGAGEKGVNYPPNQYPSAFVRMITDGYLKAMGTTVTHGRDLTPYDTATSAPVMLINETMARSMWPGQTPLGKVIGACGSDRQIVGVVQDVRHMALEKESGNEMYIPIRQCVDMGELVVRSTLPFNTLASNVEAAVRPIVPDLPHGTMRPLNLLVDRAVSPRRFIVTLLAGFAAFALLLASLGIYGLISYSVNRRTQEIGIRMALGASAFGLQRSIVTGSLGLAAIGLAAGVLASLILVRSVSGLLYGVPPGDPTTFAAAALAMLLIAALAGYLPARRVSKIDPMDCLRAE